MLKKEGLSSKEEYTECESIGKEFNFEGIYSNINTTPPWGYSSGGRIVHEMWFYRNEKIMNEREKGKQNWFWRFC